MFAVGCSYVHMLDVVASRCRLPFHSYLQEVMDDGVVLGGVELDVDVPGCDALTMRRFFWSRAGIGCPSLHDDAALQAICFLQSLYGFVVVDYNYKSMLTYRELARSAVVLAASLVRSSVPVVADHASAAVGPQRLSQQRSNASRMDDMDIGAVCDEGSPDSASSRTRTPEPKDDDYLIVIPYSHIFSLMLQALKLPPAIYHHKTCPSSKSPVTVTFNSSLQLFDGLLVPTSISGMISNNYEEAEDSAAIEAIRFMEDAYGKEMRDYHYTHVKRLENQVKYLVKWLVAANETIKKLRKGWYYAVRYMSSYSTQIQNTTDARHLRGQDGTKGVMKTALASIEELAERLRYITMKSEQRLETTRDSFW